MALEMVTVSDAGRTAVGKVAMTVLEQQEADVRVLLYVVEVFPRYCLNWKGRDRWANRQQITESLESIMI